MNAEIITIGDEILIGQILDSNSKWIAEQLNNIGISVYQITSIQDDEVHIKKAIALAEKNADIILLTGGLGPTKDDITKHTITAYFKDKLVFNKEIEKHIKNLFRQINYQYTDLDLQQAMLPSKALILKNKLGTASGMWFKTDKKILISLPGVPNEMKGLLINEVIPKLQQQFTLPFIFHKTLVTYGKGESQIAKILVTFENELPKEISLAYLPSYGKTRLRLTAKHQKKDYIKPIFDAQITQLKYLVKDILASKKYEDNIEITIGKLLNKKNATLATAESCTGGNVAKLLTAIPGASNYFIGSIVCYNARIKTDILKIPKKLIDTYSVVSEQVAIAMAVNIKALFETDYAIAITGNAGPTSDKTDQSIGVVFIAIATPNKTIVKEFNFGQPREKVITKASLKSLLMLADLL